MKLINKFISIFLAIWMGLTSSAIAQNFVIDWFNFAGGGDVNLRWESVPGKTYGILQSTNLSNWTEVVSAPGQLLRVPAATGNRTEAQLNAPVGPAAFYRIKDATFPSDPVEIAPPTNPNQITSLADSTAFLHTGSDPIQKGVAPGTIQAVRAAVVRGRVLNAAGQPLLGVSVTIKGHPELGSTVSRSDGFFDLAVNGGGPLTIDYRLTGYLPGQRLVRVPWRDFVIAPDIALITPDPQGTAIDLANATTIQVARGGTVSDARGARTATVLFPPGTQATMTLPNGSTAPLPSLNVRATEYTVGPQGPARMPGPLPPTSAYTYAVDLTVDEAITAGATRVSFSQPVPFYVDNFLGFPTGIEVPTAYYDGTKSAWVPVPDGRVIKILTIVGGSAEIDSTGEGLADNGVDIGMTTAERETLALTYAAGQSLWRVAIDHFTPYDLNYPVEFPEDATGPQVATPIPATTSGGGKSGGGGNNPESNCCGGNSEIDNQEQRLRESIGIVGTPFALNYASDRMPGYAANRRVIIQVSGPTIPASLKSMEVSVTVAGRAYSQTFAPQTNQAHQFEWNGKNAYGQEVFGAALARVAIAYSYENYYARSQTGVGGGGGTSASFGRASGLAIPGNIRGQDGFKSKTYSLLMGKPPGVLAGWSLNNHHVYDPNGGVLYQGDGQQRQSPDLNEVITTIAGTGTYGAGGAGDGGPAKDAQLGGPFSTTVAADGTLFIVDFVNTRIRRVSPDGIISTAASNFGGDYGPTSAGLDGPRSLVLADDGSLIIANSGNGRIQRVTTNGIVTTVTVGNQPVGLALGPDGSLYFGEYGNHRIRRVGPDGNITTVAGTGTQGFSGDGGPATSAQLWGPTSVAVANDGSLIICDVGNNRIRRVTPDGIINTVAGNGSYFSPLGDGSPAVDVSIVNPQSCSVGPDGSIYIADTSNDRIRRVGSDGIIVTVAGTSSSGIATEGGLATATRLAGPTHVAVAPDGGLVVTELNKYRILKVAPALPGFDLSEVLIASPNGAEVYVFDSLGRHLRTIDALTGAERYLFSYDSVGRIVSIVDGDANTTVIERDGSGKPLAIIAPDGQRTTLTLNSDGLLRAATNPAGETSQMTYWTGGLLAAFTNPRGFTSGYLYDAQGRIAAATSADGYGQSILRDDSEAGYAVDRVTAAGSSYNYSVEFLSAGGERRVTTFPDGTATEVIARPDGRTTTTLPDKTTITRTDGPDPRFSMLAPVAQVTITTNGSLVSTQQITRAVQLADTNNPLSLVALTETRSLNGKRSTNTFTAATRTFIDSSAAGRTRATEIDEQGRPVRVSVPGITNILSAYDERGRLTNVIQGTRSTRFAYDSNGFLSSITDPLERKVTFTNDAAGRVLNQTRPDGQRIQFAYDANGNLKSLTPPGRPAHTFDYTSGDLEAAYRAPDLGDGLNVTSNEFNLERRLEKTILPGGGIIDPSYDAAGRVASLAIGRGTYGYRYEAANGLLKSITAPGGSGLTNLYLGSLVAGQVWSGQVAGSVTQTYNRDYQVVSRSVNGGHTISNAYDNDGLLVKAGNMTFTRNSQNGALTGTALGVVTDSYQYNEFGEVTNYTARVSGNPILAISYVRDRLGRITEKTETESGVTTVFGYSYDLAGQLIEVRRNAVVTSAYTYDSNGNRLSRAGPGINETGTYDAQDRLLTYGNASYTYTPDGRLHTKAEGGQTTTYTYDELGNLIRVDLPNGDVVEYVVDGQNRRVARKLNGLLERAWLYQNQLRPAAELEDNGNVVSRFVYGTGINVPEYLIRNGVTNRILLDHLGSPRIVVDVESGLIAQRLEHDEFGNAILDTSPGFQPFGFAGGIYEASSTLTRFGARDFDSISGRWTTRDPNGLADSDYSSYRYSANDPINSIDPQGQYWQFVVLGTALVALAVKACFKSEGCRTTAKQVFDALKDPKLLFDIATAPLNKFPPLSVELLGPPPPETADAIKGMKCQGEGYSGSFNATTELKRMEAEAKRLGE